MERLLQKYAEDAAALYTTALMNLSPWNSWTQDKRPRHRTEEILMIVEQVIQRDPQHEGALHSYIHTIEPVDPKWGEAAVDAILAKPKLGDNTPFWRAIWHYARGIGYTWRSDNRKALPQEPRERLFPLRRLAEPLHPRTRIRGGGCSKVLRHSLVGGRCGARLLQILPGNLVRFPG